MTNLFGHPVRTEVLLLFVAETLACFAALYFALGWGTTGLPGASRAGIALPALLAACAGLVAGMTGLYQPGTWLRMGRLLLGAGAASLLLIALVEVVHSPLSKISYGPAPLHWAIALMFGLVGAVTLTRLALLLASRGGLLRRRLVLVHAAGASSPAPWIQQDPFLDVALALPIGSDVGAALTPARLRGLGVWAVVAEDTASLPASLRASLASAGFGVLSEAEFFEHRLGRIDLARLPPDWRPTDRAPGTLADAAVRRGFDLAVSLALLALTLPVLLVAAAAIRIEDPGPVFYRQERVGRGGRVFSLLKFRSMVVDAEAGGSPRWASRGDPRVTRVGRILRLTRIDEIPQVINVLRGDMAFIGPRPERPVFVEQLGGVIPHYDERALVKPGITGWAQVNYPYGASVEDARMKLSYDLYYLERRSLFLDLLILIATVRVILFQEGSR